MATTSLTQRWPFDSATQMGHADTEMIVRHYGKWIPDSREKGGYRPVNSWDEFASAEG